MNKIIDEFIEYLSIQKNYSDMTTLNYKKDLEEYSIFLKSKNYKYDNMDYKKCIDYLLFLDEKKLKKTSISRRLSSLRTFYKFLVLNNYVNTNPFSLVSSPKKEKKIPSFINYEGIEEIFNIPNIKTIDGQREKVILEVLYGAGIRVSELVNIKIKDIDFDNKTILIFGKGSKERIVSFGEPAKEAMKMYINDSRKQYLNGKESEYLIVGNNTSKLTTRRIEQIIDKIITKTSIKMNITPHMFRHTFATHLLDNGCNLIAVQELLGHESLSSTEIYTHVSNEHLRDVYMKCHPRNVK
ncbi:MAG: tyrosine recombinase [Bacilli bacterium]|nr:tyrosine recombinase [Bacilli bacterium]